MVNAFQAHMLRTFGQKIISQIHNEDSRPRGHGLGSTGRHICHMLSAILSFGLKGRSLPLLLQKLIDIRGSDYVDACIHDGGHSFPLSQIVQDIDAFDAHCVWSLTDKSVAFALF
jgi:hypothetical protein